MRRIFLLALAACGLTSVAPWHEPLHDVDAGTALRLELDELVDASDLVLEARVLETRSYETATGRIETECRLDVERTFWGAEVAERSVVLPGGVLADGRGLLLPGMASLRAGEDALLFLSHPGASGVRVPVGLAQGKLEVLTSLSGERSLRRETGRLTLADPASGALNDSGSFELFDYAESVAEIRAASERKALTGSALGGAR